MPYRRPPAFPVFLALLVSFPLWVGVASAQPAFLVKDLNTTKPRTLGSRDLAPMVQIGTDVFFVGDDGGIGAELWKLNTSSGAVTLVKDICPGACPSFPWQLVASGGQLFFRADDGTHGAEVWRSDGTAAGTFMLPELNPGRDSSFLSEWVGALGSNTLLFSGKDRLHGYELWALDTGTLQTRRVADINPGPSHSSPRLIAVAGGRALFSAYESDTYDAQLWITDGTTPGTHRVRNPGTLGPSFFSQNGGGSYPGIGLPDGSFLFGANDLTHGYELWRTDGTDAGTAMIADLNPNGDSLPHNFVAFGGKIYFGAMSDTASGLWVTDGTGAGTALVKATGSRQSGDIPGLFTIAGGQLFFAVAPNFIGRLWKTDGTTAGTVDLGLNQVLAITPLGNSVAALTGSGVFPGGHLKMAKSDGTVAGTVLVKDAGLQDRNCLFDLPMSTANGQVLFYGCSADAGQQLWKSDGTEAGTVVAQSPTRTPSFPFADSSFQGPWTFLRSLGSELVFSADDGGQSTEVWKTDGTPQGTWTLFTFLPRIDLWPRLLTAPPLRLKNTLLYAPTGPLWAIRSGPNPPETLLPVIDGSTLREVGDLALFSSSPFDLWKTDGTAPGTAQISNQSGVRLGVVGTQLFLQVNGDEIWKTDGTGPGTVLVKDLNLGANTSASGWTATRRLLFFIVRDQAARTETLWRTDGTDAGTLPLRSFPQPTASPAFFGIERLFPAGDRVLFGADDGVHGREVWVSDGTVPGTRMAQDTRPGSQSSHDDLFSSVIVRTRLFYLADDGVHGQELWVSDGTDAGTHLVKDVNPGAASSQGGVYLTAAAVRSRLFFLADDGVHGFELWVTDGSDAGTHLVKDVLPGAAGALLSQLTPMGSLLLFSASDGTHGGEPWVSDGTSAGTFMIQDVAPGAPSSGPLKFTSASSLVYFLADDGTTGTELWSLPRAALAPSFTDVPFDHWAWGYIEALADAGLTNGCSSTQYCPSSPVTRAEMAAFLEKGLRGSELAPPAPASSRFTDVPADFWAAGWIEQLADDGITVGCAPGRYCPSLPVSRAEMAAFLLRTRHGAGYTPPPVTSTRFTDVPAGFWATAWIEQLAVEGITTGCTPTTYCPDDPVGRDQVAGFLARTFRLPLP